MSSGAEPPAGTGRLVLVATPIGNLGDLPPRAVDVLREADLICCEDTRRTRALLSAFEIPAGRRLAALHGHNEMARAGWVCEQVRSGALVALVSDAGTPAVSDPGSVVVAQVAEAGLPISVVPGPSAALAALVVSGLATDRFAIEGFLPRKGAERRRRLDLLAAEGRTTVVFEAPTRVAATLGDLRDHCGGDRRVVVARELTKVHEEVWRGSLADGAEAFAGRSLKGEVVLVLEGARHSTREVGADELRSFLEERLAAGESVREAAEHAEAVLGVPHRRAYQAALEVRRSPGTSPTAG